MWISGQPWSPLPVEKITADRAPVTISNLSLEVRRKRGWHGHAWDQVLGHRHVPAPPQTTCNRWQGIKTPWNCCSTSKGHCELKIHSQSINLLNDRCLGNANQLEDEQGLLWFPPHSKTRSMHHHNSEKEQGPCISFPLLSEGGIPARSSSGNWTEGP